METQSDHDLLVRLDEQINYVRADIRELKDGTAQKINDIEKQISEHETRLKKLENKVSNYFITLTLYSIAVGSMIGLIIYHILQK